MNRKDRNKRMALIRPTLENPDIVLEEYDPKEGALRPSKLLFVKTFLKREGGRLIHFESVSVKQPGAEVVISNHEIKENSLKNKMQNNKILHLRNGLALESEMRLSEAQAEGSDLLPTSAKFRNKDNTFQPYKQTEEGNNGGLSGLDSEVRFSIRQEKARELLSAERNYREELEMTLEGASEILVKPKKE